MFYCTTKTKKLLYLKKDLLTRKKMYKKNKFIIILDAAKKARMLEQNKIKLLYTQKKQYPVAVVALQQILKKTVLDNDEKKEKRVT